MSIYLVVYLISLTSNSIAKSAGMAATSLFAPYVLDHTIMGALRKMLSYALRRKSISAVRSIIVTIAHRKHLTPGVCCFAVAGAKGLFVRTA